MRFLPILFLFFILNYPQDIKAELTLTLQTLEGDERNIDFGQLRTMDEKGEFVCESSARTVIIRITNTTGRRYKVSQRLARLLLNERNNELSSKSLSFITFGQTTSGKLFVQVPQEPGLEKNILFISDSQGSNDSFQIQYHLQSEGEAKSGRYCADIIYSVEVIE